jgi:hypothetical protein
MIPTPSAEYLARLKGRPQHEYEHGSGFQVPSEVTNDPDLIDISWHNDVCPSFACKADDPDEPIRLWVNHPDPEQREYDRAERFLVTDAESELLYEGEDIRAALQALKDAVGRRELL